MEVSPFLSPAGEAVFKFGGPHAHSVHALHGWVCSLEWTKERRRFIRSLVIWPAPGSLAMPGSIASGAWTITDSAVTELLDVDRDGKATGRFRMPFAEEQARQALPILGKDPNDREALRSLLDVVMRFGPDVYTIPVAPRAAREALAGAPMWDIRARAKSNGKVISEASV